MFMDPYSTFADEQSDVLAGVYEQLSVYEQQGSRRPEENSALRLEVCLELLAHINRFHMPPSESVQ